MFRGGPSSSSPFHEACEAPEGAKSSSLAFNVLVAIVLLCNATVKTHRPVRLPAPPKSARPPKLLLVRLLFKLFPVSTVNHYPDETCSE